MKRIGSGFTVPSYLEMERASEERHDFIDGDVFERNGERPAHNDISVNLIVELGKQLRDSGDRVRGKGTLLRVGPRESQGQNTLFTFPDLVVISNEPHYQDHLNDVLLNPSVIVEILSESTELFDRGEKFQRYRNWLPSLTDYILVSQTAPLVEHFTRKEGDVWELHPASGFEAVVNIKSVNCSLKLADIYRRIEFPPMEDDEEA